LGRTGSLFTKENMEEATQKIEIYFRGVPESKVFYDIIGYQLGSGFIGVQMKNGVMYIYPSDRVDEVIFTQE